MNHFRTSSVLFIVATGLTTLSTFAQEPAKTESPKPDPLSWYDTFERQGFKIMVSRRVIQVGQVLKCLDQRLKDIAEFEPAGFAKSLREVVLWIEPGDARHLIGANHRLSDVGYIPIDNRY